MPNKSTIPIDNETKLLHDNMGLVVKVAQSFNPPNATELDEYVQLGRIGFIKAVRNYDKDRPDCAKLSTIAWKYMRTEIIKYLNQNKMSRNLPLRKDVEQTPKSTPLWEVLSDDLTRNEKKVIEYKCQGYTLKEIGDKLGGYSREWARQLFNSAVRKLQDA